MVALSFYVILGDIVKSRRILPAPKELFSSNNKKQIAF
jgi:hypothetical protein